MKLDLDSLKGVEVIAGSAKIVTYRRRRALHLSPAPGSLSSDEAMVAVVSDLDFRDGTIEVQVAGAPLPRAPDDARGFIGVLFRASNRGARAENIYLRPTNARARDQLRRNHSVQYTSEPEFPWHRLREESPGVYESYVDLVPGAWTRMSIRVVGTRAQLFVNGAGQPCLIVNDLKLGETHGQIGLWSERSTNAYFADLSVRKK
jgi:hypothetical protein